HTQTTTHDTLSLHDALPISTETPSSVTSVIAEVGFEETPIRPTILDDTTTKQTPKIATPSAAMSRAPRGILPARRFGTTTRVMIDRKSTRLNSSHVAISYAV